MAEDDNHKKIQTCRYNAQYCKMERKIKGSFTWMIFAAIFAAISGAILKNIRTFAFRFLGGIPPGSRDVLEKKTLH